MDSLYQCVDYWKQAPLSNHIIDPYNHKSWYTPWEIIYKNYFDLSSISIVIYYSLILSDNRWKDDLELWLINDGEDECLITVYKEHLLLNYKNTICNISDTTFNIIQKYKYNDKLATVDIR
jgi:hypothetical protein